METKEKAVRLTASPQRQDKDTHFLFQRQRVFQSFRESPKTMLQVSQETGIYRANICRYIHNMRNNGTIYRLSRRLCPISQNKAIFWTTSLNVALGFWANATLSGKDYGREEQIALLACIKSYIAGGYDGSKVDIPAGFSGLWNMVRQEIDRRIAL